MSAGPGRVMRAIADAISHYPALSVADLCQRAYPSAGAVQKKHRVAVIRAMKQLEKSRDDLLIIQECWTNGKAGGYSLVLCRTDIPDALYNYVKSLPYESTEPDVRWVGESFKELFQERRPQRLAHDQSLDENQP